MLIDLCKYGNDPKYTKMIDAKIFNFNDEEFDMLTRTIGYLKRYENWPPGNPNDRQSFDLKDFEPYLNEDINE